MKFEQFICTQAVFDQLGLPRELLHSPMSNPIGKPVQGCSEYRYALFFHPLHYSEYPTQSISIYVRGTLFSAFQDASSPIGISRFCIPFEVDEDPSTIDEVENLLIAATVQLGTTTRENIRIERKSPWQ